MGRYRILVLISVRGGYYRNLIRGAYRYAAARGGWTMSNQDPSVHRSCPSLANFDGAIYCMAGNAYTAAELAASGKPVIDASNWVAATPGVVSITSDDEAAGALAAEHLLGLGHRHFGFAGLASGMYSQRRGDGFVRRLAREGHGVSLHTLYEGVHVDGVYVNQVERTMVWLRSLPKPCGVLVCADQDALHVSQIAASAGISIPDEVALIGVDDDDLVCDLAHPPLTSVRMDGVSVGLAAARALDRQLGEGVCEVSRRLPPIGVTVRPSTESRPIADPVVRGAVAWLRQQAAGRASISDCAEAVDVSLRTLQARFAAVLGHGPAEELLRLRLDHACRLLAETDMPLKAVAACTGFASAAYFCTAFARERGMTPGSWRKQALSRRAG